jgi:hypothetical protein
MKTYGGLEVPLPAFLNSALYGGEWSASRPGRFTPPPREIIPSTHLISGWLCPTAGLDAVAKRKIPSPCQVSNPDRSARSLVAMPTELSRFPSEIMCSETPNTPKCKQLASKTNRVSIMVPTCCILGCM